MATNYKALYGPTQTPDSSEHTIYTAGAKAIISAFTISNLTGSPVTGTIKITPAGGSKIQVWQRQVPGFPVAGGIIQVAEMTNQILEAGASIQFTDAAGGALVPYISGVEVTV
jgi:hypothetical protein